MHEDPFRRNRYVHYCDHGDGFMGGNLSVKIYKTENLNVPFIICELYFGKLLRNKATLCYFLFPLQHSTKCITEQKGSKHQSWRTVHPTLQLSETCGVVVV